MYLRACLKKYVILFIMVIPFAGCATHLAPADLVLAEKALLQAKEAQAQQYAPIEFHEAEKSLNKAQQSYNQKEKISRVQLYSYQAKRKAEVAQAMAEKRIAEEKLNETMKKDRKAVLKEKDTELKATREKLAELREDAALMKGALLNAAGKVIAAPSSTEERIALLEDELAKRRLDSKIARLEKELKPEAVPEKESEIKNLKQKINDLEEELTKLKSRPGGVATLTEKEKAIRSGGLLISGTVKDTEGNPCAGALVTLKGTYQGTTTTDSQGSYTFTTKDSVSQGIIYISATYGEKKGSIKIFSSASSIKGNITVN
jgi:hypothetical protein